MITCTCGRPKWTGCDLERWRDETRDLTITEDRVYNPEWARAICWMTCEPCPMRKLEAAK